jgi:HAMP domain-containing protein
MGVRAKFNLAILAAFAIGFVAAGFLLERLFNEYAREEVLHDAEIMITAADAIRDYTTHEVAPDLGTAVGNRFFAASVPSFAAQTNFKKVQKSFSEYSYKEAALNPTNPTDRATDWEADIINTFRNTPDLKELVAERQTPTGPVLNLARPLVVRDQACLACHSTPGAAPKALTVVYGTANGFGWTYNETIGAQIVTVPQSVAKAKARHMLLAFMGVLLVVFLLIVVILNLLLHYVIIRPVKQVSAIANEVSLGNLNAPEYERKGKDEIASLSASFNRMRRSLENALKLLGEAE